MPLSKLQCSLPSVAPSSSPARFYSNAGPQTPFPGFDPNHPTVKKILESPEMMASIARFMQVLQSKGFNPKPGTRPSMAEAMRWATDPDVQRATTDIAETADRLGIKLDMATLAQMAGGAAPGSGSSSSSSGGGGLLDKAKSLLGGGRS
ncbi:hypothetical protein THASP1DRAFT_30420 [Thamnocephalis sphaerospora]|uniref:Uncharacterized protein n=1 Tax=Thamnocephalis sphaerospora TaxID=78915 RepID=A0A4P9XP58_9FUNG|nr:hypothetical protein THASP1DRAFT_30420 [Thamnocephalis sphaerospora]|eukprot:RKP07765.1 hypothetical protein THASP1DRAFT_30420 [Thamnocephalis sphaerospora]